MPNLSSQLTRKRRFSQLLHWLNRHQVPESSILLFTALVVGVGAGFAAMVFRWLIESINVLAYTGLAGLLANITPYHLCVIPAIGGLIFGPIVYRFAPEAKGPGVAEVMKAMVLHGGRIRPQVALLKALVSSVCIGTGGAVGREGPIAQIGSSIGSTVGQVLNLSDEHVRNLVACGAAGGIAATFNAPIAGSIFALEVILGSFQAVNFSSVVISAVVADVIAQTFGGNLRAFVVPEYTLVDPRELVFYLALGIIAAVLSVAFSWLLHLSGDLWDAIPLAEYLKPAVGGLLLGVVGILTFKIDGFPRIFGVGYNSISDAIFGHLAIGMTIGLLFTKMLATCLTLGAGGSGGVFAPLLFMGAMLGSTFGQIIHQLFPDITASSGAYATVGMAAFFSSASHAPITAILILLEMTGDYGIILPLMLTTVISYLVSRTISHESIYTLKLTQIGVHRQQGQDIDVMQSVTVREAMTTDVDVVSSNLSLNELAEEFERTHHHGFPVIDAEGKLTGVVSIGDLERVRTADSITGKTVVDIATTEKLLVAYPSEQMWVALRRLGFHNVSRLPVVEKEGSRQLVGLLRRGDIVRAYQLAILKKAHHIHQSEVERLNKLDDVDFVHIDIGAQSPAVGKRISEIKLPLESLIISVRRGRKLNVVRGNTVLQEKDQVIIFTNRDVIQMVRRCLVGKNEED